MKKEVDNLTLAMNLRRLRGNLSQSKVAKEIGAQQPSYSAWEKGEYRPSSQYLQKLCAFFNVTINQLTGVEMLPNTIPTSTKKVRDNVDILRNERYEAGLELAEQKFVEIIENLSQEAKSTPNEAKANRIRLHIAKLISIVGKEDYARLKSENADKDAKIAELNADNTDLRGRLSDASTGTTRKQSAG